MAAAGGYTLPPMFRNEIDRMPSRVRGNHMCDSPRRDPLCHTEARHTDALYVTKRHTEALGVTGSHWCNVDVTGGMCHGCQRRRLSETHGTRDTSECQGRRLTPHAELLSSASERRGNIFEVFKGRRLSHWCHRAGGRTNLCCTRAGGGTHWCQRMRCVGTRLKRMSPSIQAVRA